jgi:hypothetical protein
MSQYRISGVWVNSNRTITHYAFHTRTQNSYTRAQKISKTDAILLLDNPNNSAKTWLWDYSRAYWRDGEDVEVVNGRTEKYLRSFHDNRLSNNLEHLINFDWIDP